MDRNWDSKNHVSKLITEDIGDILSPLAPAIGSDQITYPQVVHLHVDVGRLT